MVLFLAGCAGTPDDARVAPRPTATLAAVCPEPHAAAPFEHPGIQEASGIARSGRETCVFWVHDDSGAPPVLYAIDGAGGHLGEAWLDVPAVDWEDVAAFSLGGAPFLLVADTGNNGLSRSSVSLIVLPEPERHATAAPWNITVHDVVSITLRYPDGGFDIEAVAVDPDADQILVVSKGATQLPVDPSGPNQALYTASLAQALSDREATLAFETFIPGIRAGPGDPTAEYNYGVGGGRTTAMDLRPDRGEVAILTYREILAWPRSPSQSWSDALGGVPRAIAVPDPGKDQMEGLAYSHDGGMLLVADELGATNSEMTIVTAEP